MRQGEIQNALVRSAGCGDSQIRNLRYMCAASSSCFGNLCFLGRGERGIDFQAGGGGEDAGVGVGVEGEEPGAAAELGEGDVHGVKGSGVEAGAEAFDEFDGAVCSWIPGDGITEPCAGVRFVGEDLPGFAAGVAGAANEGAASFEFGEAADEEGDAGFADVSFGFFALAGDVEVEGGDGLVCGAGQLFIRPRSGGNSVSELRKSSICSWNLCFFSLKADGSVVCPCHLPTKES